MMTWQCPQCKLYLDKTTCKAFPKGIPKAMILGKEDHRKPLVGDGGIRFSRRKPK